MNAHLQLLFHADHLKFSLVREFDEWRQEFNRLKEALTFAKSEGARELPFMMLGESGELFTESVVTVEPQDFESKIFNPEELARFLSTTLKTRDDCRVFSDVLNRCWGVSREKQEQAIQQFAKEHGWDVKIHEPGSYGIVADFTKASAL